MPTHPVIQLERYRAAVEALGGVEASSRALGYSSRHAARLYSGASPLHEGILTNITDALEAHAATCKDLARQLVPYTHNLTAGQLAARADGKGRPGRKRGGSNWED